MMFFILISIIVAYFQDRYLKQPSLRREKRTFEGLAYKFLFRIYNICLFTQIHRKLFVLMYLPYLVNDLTIWKSKSTNTRQANCLQHSNLKFNRQIFIIRIESIRFGCHLKKRNGILNRIQFTDWLYSNINLKINPSISRANTTTSTINNNNNNNNTQITLIIFG